MLCTEDGERGRRFLPVPSGRAYRVNAAPDNAAVTAELRCELNCVLERFAKEAGFSELSPVSVEFGQGIAGHHQIGRAADIYGLEGIGLDRWKRRWDERLAAGRNEKERRALARREGASNLGWRLYKAMQRYGRWAQPDGHPMQLVL